MKKTDGIAIAKMDELRKMIVEKLRGKSPKVDEALLKAKQGDPIISRLNQCGKKPPQTLNSVEQTMLKNVKVTGDIDLDDLTQEA